MSLGTVFLIVALILFILAAIGVSGGPVNFVALGLAFWVAAILWGGVALSVRH